MKPNFDLSLYLVTDRPLAGNRDISKIVEDSVKGGVTIVQLREKDCSTAEFIAIASDLKKKLEPFGIPLIINDRIDVALAVDADGVHIGQSDMPYAVARRLLGKDKIIGLSVETLEEVVKANELDVDYIGISPVYATPTKTDTLSPFGIDGLRKSVALSRHRIVAIGGMNATTIGDVMSCGAEGVAVVSAIVAADSPCDASRELAGIVNNSRPKWSDIAYRMAQSITDEIKSSPFNTELMYGTLPLSVFSRYLQQDMIYLANYDEEMKILANKVDDKDAAVFFNRLHEDGVANEEKLHKLLSERFGISKTEIVSEVTERYMQHTRKLVDSGDIALALASLLPCFWVYDEIGRHLLLHCKNEGNPYMDWITAYSSDFMKTCVDSLAGMCDSFAQKETMERRAEMYRVFIRSVELERDFFDYVYNGK